MMLAFSLFWHFLLISALAFGGGQAALPLVERIAVAENGWIPATDFTTAVAFGYVTPGPVLITATFIGYRADGVLGAVAATVGVFLLPWFLATSAAQLLRRALQNPRLRAFGRGAASAWPPSASRAGRSPTGRTSSSPPWRSPSPCGRSCTRPSSSRAGRCWARSSASWRCDQHRRPALSCDETALHGTALRCAATHGHQSGGVGGVRLDNGSAC